MKKNIAIIGTVGLPANYGGFETLANHLVENLDEKYNLTVYCSSKRYPKEKRKCCFHHAKLVYIPFDANGIQSIIYDTISILHAIFYADVLLILGVPGAWILPFVKWFTNKKIIISIDGIEWKRDKWGKWAKKYLRWAEKLAVKYSHIDISDNESIQDYTAENYNSLSRIVEYGADHTSPVIATAQDKKKYPFVKLPYAFKVCRIEPENNIELVLKSFSFMPDYMLVIVGNWKNSEYGILLKEKYKEFKNIIMLDPIYDQRIIDMLRSNAMIYVHGHSAGGTNPSLVEAMYLGKAIACFDVNYNRTTTENKALYFKDTSSLIQIIKNTSVEQIKNNAATMKEIANRRYTWKVIIKKYEFLIDEALSSHKKQKITPTISSLDKSILDKYQISHLKNQYQFYKKNQ